MDNIQKLVFSRVSEKLVFRVIYGVIASFFFGHGILLSVSTGGIQSTFDVVSIVSPATVKQIIFYMMIISSGLLFYGIHTPELGVLSHTFAILTLALWFYFALVASVRFSSYTSGWTIGTLLMLVALFFLLVNIKMSKGTM